MLVYHIYELKIEKRKQVNKNKQSFSKSPDTHENLHSQKPESFSESNDTHYAVSNLQKELLGHSIWLHACMLFFSLHFNVSMLLILI
jgi:hypothetical protein